MKQATVYTPSWGDDVIKGLPRPDDRPIDIAGVPRTIKREAVVKIIEGLGLDASNLLGLAFRSNAIEIECYALDEEGQRYQAAPSSTRAAYHRITIPVVD